MRSPYRGEAPQSTAADLLRGLREEQGRSLRSAAADVGISLSPAATGGADIEGVLAEVIELAAKRHTRQEH